MKKHLLLANLCVLVFVVSGYSQDEGLIQLFRKTKHLG